MKRIVTMLLATALSGCMMGDKISEIRPGMTKSQVVAKLGEPDGFKVAESYEMLRYSNRMISGGSWDRADYEVVLRNGVVVEAGTGDVRAKNGPMVFVPVRY